MGRFARIVLVVVALALVLAPRAVTTATHDGPRLLTAAVLAPATGDGDAVTPAREREAAPVLALLAVLVAALAVRPRTPRGHGLTRVVVDQPSSPSDPRPRRRGPPRTFA